MSDVVELVEGGGGEPGFEFGRRAEAEESAQIERVVKRGALVVEHDVVGAGHAHDVVDAGGAEQGEQRVHVVLIGFGVVGVADVAAHGQAEQLAAEVIFEAGAEDLLAVVEVFGADEADDGVDEHGVEVAGDGVGAGLAGLLVDSRDGRWRRARCPGRFRSTSRCRRRSCDAAAMELARPGVGFASRARLMPKEALAASVPAMDWKTRSTGAPLRMASMLGGDVGEDAGLRGNGVALADVVDQPQQGGDGGDVVGRRG